MNTIFFDTVGLIALWDERDQWHQAAKDAFSASVPKDARIITTSFVLLECGNAAARRPYRNDVEELPQELAARGDLIVPSADDELAAWSSYRRAEFGNAGIIDHISFIVMKRLGITAAFTNDSHFRAAGFVVLF